RLVLHGRYNGRQRFGVQAHARTSEAPAGAANGAPPGAVAHYPATDGLSSTQILALVRRHAAATRDVPEPLPARVRSTSGLPDRPAAVAAAHFPREPAEVEEGRRRLAFDELLLAQLVLRRRRRLREQASTAPVLDAARSLTERWLA